MKREDIESLAVSFEKWARVWDDYQADWNRDMRGADYVSTDYAAGVSQGYRNAMRTVLEALAKVDA